MTLPWRNWYHCVGNTFGTWPLGDDRGFRTRHHRQNVVGNYRFPPPPRYYEALLRRSRNLMKHRPVVFSPDARKEVCDRLTEYLTMHKVEVIALSVSCMHFHLLARFVPVDVNPYEHLASLGVKLTHSSTQARSSAYRQDPAPRRLLGMARAVAGLEVKRRGLVTCPDAIWGKRPHCCPIVERGHQVAAARYITDHALEGAAVYTILHRAS